ncbi:hypothetical protein DFS34DRAFT_648766 [Phlyctochytrium arcticum]|nr:hypothetical protein DFS34DRAFT_648766 [Phlyctochytrium arcticum]
MSAAAGKRPPRPALLSSPRLDPSWMSPYEEEAAASAISATTTKMPPKAPVNSVLPSMPTARNSSVSFVRMSSETAADYFMPSPTVEDDLHAGSCSLNGLRSGLGSPILTPRTIICEGKLSIGAVQGHNFGELPSPPKLRRRSLDILRHAFASVLGNGASGKDTVPGKLSRQSKGDKWLTTHAWLDDAALLHIEGSLLNSAQSAAQPPPHVQESTCTGHPVNQAAETVFRTPTRHPAAECKSSTMRPSYKLPRKSTDCVTTLKHKHAPRKSLDIWNRRSWSTETDTWSFDDNQSVSVPNLSRTALTASNGSHSVFKVISSEREPRNTMLLLHVELLDPADIPLESSGGLQPQSRQATTLYLRFKSSSKLDRWRSAISLAICIAQARAEANAVKEAEEKAVKADDARRSAEQDRLKAEKRLKREKREWEKRVKGMFSAEEVQDVYQETADQLTAAERKIKDLQHELAAAHATQAQLRLELDKLRAETELPVGEYMTLKLLHEELCRKLEEQTREKVLIRMLYEKELNAHKRLANILQKQALTGVSDILHVDDLPSKQS